MSEIPIYTDGFGRRYRRNQQWAVRDVSLAVPEGSITALVGPNGSGKSTLIRACLGFERPDEGRVLVRGIDPQRDRISVVNSVGYVPQWTGLYRNLTIGDHLVIGCASRPTFSRTYALRLVRNAGLSEDRKIAELSGGEQAQVALALALGTRAPLLLLDEPLASLDPLARRDFLTALVADVRERGATAVLTSHIVADVEQACDRVVVLVDGQLALDAAITAAKQEYQTMSSGEIDGPFVIGTFSGPSGELLALSRDASGGRPASLEEIVLGHLAAARTRRGQEAA